MAATGAGWAALPVNLSFGDAIKGLQKELQGPVAKAAKQAGDSLEGGIGKGADAAAKKVEKAQYRVKKSTQELKDAESKYRAEKLKQEAADKALAASADELAAAREKGGAAAEKAEEKYLKAQARSETAANNTRKASEKFKDAQEESAAAAAKLEAAESEAANATDDYADKADRAEKSSLNLEDGFKKVAAAGAVIGGAVAAAGGALVGLGAQFDDAYDTIRVGTGASGEAFEDLQESMRNVASESIGVGSDMGAIGTTLADVNTRLGLTGEPLEEMTSQLMQLQGMGIDADINALSQAFNGFGVEAEDMPNAMDELFQVSQATGLSLTELANSAVKAGPSLRGFGFSMSDSAALVGQMDKAGLDADKTLQSMQRALSEFAKEGRDAPEALNETIGSIEELISAGDEAGAIDMASNIFGTRGAAQFVDAVKTGTLSVEDFMGATGATNDTIGGLAEETADFAEKWDQFKNNVLLALEPVATAVFDSLAPALDIAAQKFQELSGWLTDTAIPAFQSFGEWVQKNRDWLEPLGVALGVMAGSLAAVAAATTAWTTATKIYGKAQAIATGELKLFNLALKNNVIGIVVTAIAALVAGLVYFFTKTETGKRIWSEFTEALGKGMDWVVEKWNQLTGGLSDGWNTVKNGVIDAWNAYWTALQDNWTIFTTAVSTAWNTVKDAFVAGWNLIKTTVIDVWTLYWTQVQDNWQLVTGALAAAWNIVKDGLSAGWNWIKTTVIDAWTMYWTNLQTSFEVIKNALVAAWNFVRDAFANVWNTIKTTVIDAFTSAFNALRGSFEVVTGALSGAWDTLKNALMAGWQWIDSNVIGGFRTGMEAFKSFFQSIVDGIGNAWDGLRSLLAKPINFMIGTVYNGGILKAWNTIAGFLPGLDKASPLSAIPEHATGGRIKGPGTGTSDDVLMWGSNGEHMLTYDDVQDLGGHSAVYAMRDALQHGRGFTFDGRKLSLLPRGIDNRKGDLVGAAPELFPKFKDGGEVRPMWEIQLERGHRWAQSRHGRPYVLGGSANGAGGTDCSGFMSGIANVIQGGDGARQWATMAFNNGGNQQMPSGPQGFVAGLKANTLSIGVTNGGAAGGHTAGTLGAVGSFPAVNVESGGAPSMVKYGVGAVGADDGYFHTHYHLPIGPDGAFVSGGNGPSPEDMRKGIKDKVSSLIDKALNPIRNMLPSGPPAWQDIPRGYFDKGKKSLIDGAFNAVEGLGDKLASVWSAAGEVKDLVSGAASDAASWVNETVRSIVVRDQGGIVRNGTAAVNLSGKDELMLPPATTAAFTQFLKDMPGTAGALERAAVAWQEAAEEFDLGGVARKSAEDYAADSGSTLLSTMGLEGLIGIGQKLGTRALEAYQADPWTAGVTGDGVWAASATRRLSASANGHGATIVIEAESDEDLVRAGQLRELTGRVNGVEVELRKPRRPKAAVVTKGGVM